MADLQEYLQKLKPNIVVRGPLFPEPVQVITTLPIGQGLKLIGTGTRTNQTYQPVLEAGQLALLIFTPETEPFDGDGTRFKLGLEAMRLGLAYEYDPYFSLSIARIDPLPHQLEAVYDYFLKLPRIRFLLADDPGAGKTIMAGLLLKELKIRGLVKRILIVTPANLTFQWQRELKDKFREDFEVVRGEVLRANYGSNPWQEKNQVITSVSWVSRIQDAKESLLRSRWDIIFVDEAHKMSAYSADKKTITYQLGEQLSEMTDHYVLATATPHKGDPENFRLFLSLLDKDVYGDISSLEEAMKQQAAPFYLRRVKEALVTFPDPDTGQVKLLFTRRIVRTTEFELSPDEWDFYNALSNYVEAQSIKAAQEDSATGRVVGFTMAMLQRRFASSSYAVRRSLERMKEKREKILADPEGYRQQQLLKRVPEDFDDLPDDEQEQLLESLEEVVPSIDPVSLREDIIKLGRLIDQARQLEQQEVETKLVKLKEVLASQGVFADPKVKLLVFTEHKDTLDYLAGDGKGGRPLGKLRQWGLSVTEIYGGMKIGDRNTPGTRLYAEWEFKEACQVMVATEAAGEGINLQFCWLTINYDIPWNPMRLEQRMGRTHRYGQEKDCLIFNFVSTNTREGRVLQKLFERIRQIEVDLDPKQTGKVFNVLGDVFPANQLERMVRDMYAHNNMTEEIIKSRIVEQVDTTRFRQITHSALEGLAKRELNLAAIVSKAAEAKERRLVPEAIEDFFVQAAPLASLQLKRTRPKNAERRTMNDESLSDSSFLIHHSSFYHLGRVPRLLWPIGERLEPRFGKLGREYKQIVFDKKLLSDDPTLEWVTPGHPLFEAVREDVLERTQADLQRGAVLYDLNRAEPACLTVFSAAIRDGRGNVLEKRLFVVEATPPPLLPLAAAGEAGGADERAISPPLLPLREANQGNEETISPPLLPLGEGGRGDEGRYDLTLRQPTLFLDLVAAPSGIQPPPDLAGPGRAGMEQFLMEAALRPLLTEVSQQRAKEVETITRHVELSLNAIIDRVQLQASELLQQKEAGSTEPGIEGRLKQFEDRLDELYGRLEQRRLELLQERQCTVADIHLHGRAWVLPHPERTAPGIAPMVRDDEIERIAVEAAIAYEQARGWQVVSVELENKGFDLISRRFHPEDPQTAVEIRFIEVKGRARVGDVALTSNEYRTAQRLGREYWLYVVYNCAASPEVHPISNPITLPWEPLGKVNYYYVDSQAVLNEAKRQRSAQTSKFEQAFREVWESRLAEWGEYNILVEGASDKRYLELAAQRYQAVHGLDLLDGGAVRIIAGAGTKRFAPYFGMLQSLEERGIKFVVILDGDEAGAVAAEAMARFKAQKNRHFFQLERQDYKDKGGKSWEVEIEDLLASRLVESFVAQHPAAVEARFQMGPVTKLVINGKPLERDGQTYDFKMMLAEYVRQQAALDDLAMLIELLQKARKCMGLKS